VAAGRPGHGSGAAGAEPSSAGSGTSESPVSSATGVAGMRLGSSKTRHSSAQISVSPAWLVFLEFKDVWWPVRSSMRALCSPTLSLNGVSDESDLRGVNVTVFFPKLALPVDGIVRLGQAVGLGGSVSKIGANRPALPEPTILPVGVLATFFRSFEALPIRPPVLRGEIWVP